MTLKSYKDTNDYIFEIAENKDLKPSEIALLFAINSLSDNDKELCFASNKIIAKKINLSVDRTSRLINGLKKKNIIKVRTFKIAQSITINDTPYSIYRLISIVMNNDSMCEDNNTPSYTQREGVGTDNVTPSVQTTNKSTKRKSTNYNSTNLSKPESRTRNTEAENTESANKGKEREDNSNSETQALFDYALDKIRDNSKIGDKASYAKVMVKNWLKQGIKSVDDLEISMTKTTKTTKTTSQRPRIVEKMPYWYSAENKNNRAETHTDKTENDRILEDIEKLKEKIGC